MGPTVTQSVANHSTMGVAHMDRTVAMLLAISRVVAEHQGTCNRRNVGAVLVADGRIREVGWNGMERHPDMGTCQDGACPRGQRTLEELPANAPGYSQCIYLHAEFNALENFRHANRIPHRPGWAKMQGIVVYVSSEPCPECKAYAEWAGADLRWSCDA